MLFQCCVCITHPHAVVLQTGCREVVLKDRFILVEKKKNIEIHASLLHTHTFHALQEQPPVQHYTLGALSGLTVPLGNRATLRPHNSRYRAGLQTRWPGPRAQALPNPWTSSPKHPGHSSGDMAQENPSSPGPGYSTKSTL